MLKVLGRADSNNVQKVMWCIGELGLEVERTDIGGKFGGNNEPAYLAMNPMGLVPTLIDGDFTLWESHSIVRYLLSTYGGESLMPTDPKLLARANQWMDWVNCALGRPMVIAFIGLYRTPPEKRNMNAIEKALKEWQKYFLILENHLADNDYMAGSEITMGDIPVGVVTYRWLNMDIERPSVPNLEEFYNRLKERPAYQQHVMLPLT